MFSLVLNSDNAVYILWIDYKIVFVLHRGYHDSWRCGALINQDIICFVIYPVFLEYINGLMQERCNSIAYVLESHLSCTNPLIY